MALDASHATRTDPWSVLDYKEFAGPRAPWLSESDSRRLGAYMVYAAYAENQGSRYGDTSERREYGDAGLLVEQALAHLLGESQTIEVDGAGDVDADGVPEDADAAGAQEWLDDWADREGLMLRVLDAERKAVSVGDAVYVLDFDAVKKRPRVGVFDPGFYFPVLPQDARADDYPSRVHLAWEEEVDAVAGRRKVLRRITYQLVDAEQPYRVAWTDQLATQQVLLTDKRFELMAASGATRDGVALDRLEGEGEDVTAPLLLPIDFLPIVHVPNTLPGADHFGQPILAKVMQVLDDLQGADTDTQAAQATTGSPMVLLKGVSQDSIRLGAGEALNVGTDGDGKVLDTSSQLAAMSTQVRDLQERLTQNARIPDVALGKVRSSAEAGMSGIALTLRYGPLESMVRQMRQVRTEKYRVLLRFAQRIGMALGDGPPVVAEARLVLGSFLPRDVAATIKSVGEGITGKIISLETGVRMLMAAGVPIEDAAEEVDRIVRRDYEAAARLVDATGNPADGRALLQLDAVNEAQGVPRVPNPAAPVTEVVEAPGQLSTLQGPGSAA